MLGLSLSPDDLIRSFGTIGLIAIIFAESGLLIGFFLPGDSLLFTAGLLVSQGKLNLAVVLVGCFLAAVIGDQVGYAFGKKAGPSIFQRPNSRLFKQQHVERANDVLRGARRQDHRHGPFRSGGADLRPDPRGVGTMPYRTFLAFNILGGFLWAVGVTLLGYFLGDVIGADNVNKYLLPTSASSSSSR